MKREGKYTSVSGLSGLLTVWFVTVFILFIPVENLSAQVLSWEDFVERMAVDESRESDAWERLFEELSERRAHPYNLNTLTRAQLETLPFLSPRQVENLLAYLYSYAPVQSLAELQLVEGLDYETRAMLALFVYVGEPTEQAAPLRWKNLWKYGEHEVVARADVPFYYRKGYYQYPPELLTRYPNRQYMGGRVGHSIRYQYTYGDRLAAGLVMENDAGEPFFNRGNRGYDYYSYYLLVHDVGHLQTLALGNYRLSFGQGLVMNTQFSPGKQAILTGIYSRNKGIKKHASTSESDYFRGAAATLRWGRVGLTGLYSYRTPDATLDGPSITSLKTDGYHRTPLEMSKKHNTRNHLIGTNLSYDTPSFHLGLTAVYTVFDRPLKPVRDYQLHDPRGRRFAAVGADYRWDLHRWSFVGETAVGGNGAVATLNAVAYRFSPAWSVLLLQRHYAKDYEGLYARSFEEGGRVRNEDGLYLGTEALLGDRVKATAYVDCFRFPFPKYRISFPGTKGVEVFAQLSGWVGQAADWMVRYRFKNKGRDFTPDDGSDRQLAAHDKHTAKAQFRWQTGTVCLLKTTLDYVQSSLSATGNEQGYQLGQACTLTSPSDRWTVETGASYFHTDSYETRIYASERGMLYAFSFPSYYGRGWHGYVWGRYHINKMLTLLVKYVHTRYFDRDHIGSGTQEIEGSRKQDLYLQLRLRF